MKYSPPADATFIWVRESKKLTKGTSFDDATSFYQYLREESDDDQSHLIFLTGQATPQWLNILGDHLDLDPLFYMNHLSFRPSAKVNTYALPTLPGLRNGIIRLTIPTIGHVEPERAQLPSSALQRVRRECTRKLRDSLRALDSREAAGGSVVRRFFLHDTNCFTVEQDVTISLVKEDGRWQGTFGLVNESVVVSDESLIGMIVAVVWFDCGTDQDPPIILKSVAGYEEYEFPLVPVIQESRLVWPDDDKIEKTTESPKATADQILARLPMCYGRTIDDDTAAADPFYAISEILDFIASAELQNLNMMFQLISGQIEAISGNQIDPTAPECRNTPQIADFHHSRDILDQHVRRLNDAVDLLESRPQLDWPCSDQPHLQQVAEESRTNLLGRFSFLLTQAESLVKRCDRGADLAMSNASLQLTERSFAYDKSLGELSSIGTWLAVLFVPLSLVTSAFGMNFREFSEGHLSIWIFVVVAAPILLVSVAVMLSERLKRAAMRLLKRLQDRSRSQKTLDT